MKRALVISQNFPPSTIASVHRGRHLAKHLPAFGWAPTVLAVDERFHKEPPDPGLGRLVPSDIEIVKVSALPVRPLSGIGVGDLSLRSYPFVRKQVARLLDASKYSVVFITGWPFYQMLMASWIRRKWNVPVVLDFQDPWVSAEGATLPAWSKGRMAHRLAKALEPKAVRAAAWITSVSDTQNAEMAARYPWLDVTRMSAIPIGGDPEDFEALRGSPFTGSTVVLEPDRINICYVGTFLPRAAPVVRTIFEAAARLRRERPQLANRLRFHFVGTSNQPQGSAVPAAKHLVTPIAAAAGVADLVREHAPRVSFLEALTILSKANGLLLIGSDEPHYTASKIYPALMSGTPYLSLFHRRSSSHEILTRAGGGTTHAFLEPAQLSEMVPEITNGLRRLAEEPSSLGYADPITYVAYTAHAVAGRFAQVFDAVAS